MKYSCSISTTESTRLDDDVGARLARGAGPGLDPGDVVEVDGPGGVGAEAVEAVGGRQLGDRDGRAVPGQLVELVGGGRLGLGPVGARVAHGVGPQRVLRKSHTFA